MTRTAPMVHAIQELKKEKDAEIGALKIANDGRDALMSALRTDVESKLKAELASVKAERDDMRAGLERIRADNDNLKAANDNLRAETDELRNRIEALERSAR